MLRQEDGHKLGRFKGDDLNTPSLKLTWVQSVDLLVMSIHFNLQFPFQLKHMSGTSLPLVNEISLAPNSADILGKLGKI